MSLWDDQWVLRWSEFMGVEWVMLWSEFVGG